MNDGSRELLLGRKVIMDARALHAHVRCNLAKAESMEASEPNAPFGSVHDGSRDITHELAPMGDLSVDIAP
jgi:hypothetical protein